VVIQPLKPDADRLYKPRLLCKWILHIIYELSGGEKRPSELKRNIRGITERVLYDRLKLLLKLGLVKRSSHGRYPLSTYYELNSSCLDSLLSLIRKTRLSIEDVVSVLSCKWMIPIMECLRDQKTPKEILKEIPDLSERMLYVRIDKLQSMGLVSREVILDKPVKVVYTLSPMGGKEIKVLKELCDLIASIEKRHSPCF
jgi:DNA-binding HxlR family transcriptional regulator